MSSNNSNLPPGCRESDIPGNRPCDVLYDKWYDGIDGYWEDYLKDECLEEDDGEGDSIVLGAVSLRKKYSNGGDAYDEYAPFTKYADRILENMQDPDYGRPDRYDDD